MQMRKPRPSPYQAGEIIKLARQHTRAAISTLIEVMANKEAPPSARVKAAEVILDRGYGRAPLNVSVELLAHFKGKPAELEAVARRILERRALEGKARALPPKGEVIEGGRLIEGNEVIEVINGKDTSLP